MEENDISLDDTNFDDRLRHMDEGTKASSSKDAGAGKSPAGISDAEKAGHKEHQIGSIAEGDAPTSA